jgi:hypothetical protein
MNSTGKKVYKALRWAVLIALVVAVALMLKRPSPATHLTAATVQEKSVEFNAKLEGLKASGEYGQAGNEASFTSDEVNSFIADSSARAAEQAAHPEEHPAAGDNVPGTPLEPALSDAEIQAALDKTQIAFEGDEVVAQTTVQRYGRDIYVTVRGRLGASGGYLVFTPTGFKIGSLSVPVSMVNDRLQEKLVEPENREKLKLPDFIAAVHVENGELKIKEK